MSRRFGEYELAFGGFESLVHHTDDNTACAKAGTRAQIGIDPVSHSKPGASMHVLKQVRGADPHTGA